MHQTLVRDPESGVLRSAVDYYMLRDDLTSFRVAVPFDPYFYLAVADEHFKDIEVELRKTFDRHVHEVVPAEKIDLSEKNHLAPGHRRTFMKVSFLTVQALMAVRAALAPIVARNRERAESVRTYEGPQQQAQAQARATVAATGGSFFEFISDMRENDVPYHIRASIDKDIRVANWYRVEFHEGVATMVLAPDLATKRPAPRVLAFDIETTKMPLKFPDPASDTVMMISYMCDRRGYLIVNREVVSEDTQDFEYTPKPEMPGIFKVTNVPDEAALLRTWFAHAKELRPHLYVTFNGDFFDWPFLDTRASAHGMSLAKELGVRPSQKKDYYASRYAPHLDCFAWVQRDSYLPHGSQGLKAVTKAKLGYDPLELDPEDMVRLAREQPRKLTDYSVSDAVATYYLYQQHIHPFIFSLCTIIPMGPDDVLRKGSGTLCENLLMVEAFKASIIYPNKAVQRERQMHKGHLLDSETYVGGHVESLESGVFRSDIPMKFRLESRVFQELRDSVPSILEFAANEAKIARASITNFDSLVTEIEGKLTELRDVGLGTDGFSRREEKPLIVHLDVAAMYPNIILTNRLQPCAIVAPEICAACLHNRPENRCKRPMKWVWRGDYIPANRSEYELIRTQIESERFTVAGKSVSYFELEPKQQLEKLVARLKDYSRKVYKRSHVTEETEREDTVCMRENSFYVDTVRAFRDRRYTYKDKLKEAKGIFDAAVKANDPVRKGEAEKLVVMYDSQQLAHKCILNSFYGYVMRKGSRWMSIQMAGIVTHTGLNIITRTRELVQRIGRPLELDTDGIWCALPASFPFNFRFALESGKQV
jgi:DNA polymerase epsilon subunit 1